MKPLSLCKSWLLIVLAALFSMPAASQVDPTKPAISGVSQRATNDEQEGALRLQSILKRQDSFTAVISGRSYREGDSVGDHRIVKINPKDVVLDDGRQTMTLKMYSYEIKK